MYTFLFVVFESREIRLSNAVWHSIYNIINGVLRNDRDATVAAADAAKRTEQNQKKFAKYNFYR